MYSHGSIVRFLHANALPRVSSGAFMGLTQLRLLHLHLNKITVLEPDCFRDQKQSLEVLYVVFHTFALIVACMAQFTYMHELDRAYCHYHTHPRNQYA